MTSPDDKLREDAAALLGSMNIGFDDEDLDDVTRAFRQQRAAALREFAEWLEQESAWPQAAGRARRRADELEQ